MSDTEQQQTNGVVDTEPEQQRQEDQPQTEKGTIQHQQSPQHVQPWQQPQPQAGPPLYQGRYVENPGPIRQSRIKDRPQPKETRDSSLKVKIELDLEAEVDLYARVKGDVTIGLM
ncbi:hypothetical protein MPDQ_002899 [Monascus purpureus]|uniref:Uncharacterized protein n=1 Tax=Monascus purpureus TaxID=5098 RepID=A0A507QNJ5_MONPU|nr:hypothetical protein MPDQ_002899 [Monascus purpureus]BDD59735.1 hypothetical protein MAP00_004927 [Monascus purpureus]